VAEVLAARPGLELTCVARGADGLRALRARPYDLLLLDLDLPDLRGEDLLAVLAADPALAGVAVCTISGRTPTVSGARHLRKPVAVRDLLAFLDELRSDPRRLS